MPANPYDRTLGVKEFTIKTSSFSQEKLMMEVLSLVFEPIKNRPCIDEWRE
jgi:hypothetical protein